MNSCLIIMYDFLTGRRYKKPNKNYSIFTCFPALAVPHAFLINSTLLQPLFVPRWYSYIVAIPYLQNVQIMFFTSDIAKYSDLIRIFYYYFIISKMAAGSSGAVAAIYLCIIVLNLKPLFSYTTNLAPLVKQHVEDTSLSTPAMSPNTKHFGYGRHIIYSSFIWHS